MIYDPVDIEDFFRHQWWYILLSASSSPDEKLVGCICIECEADLSFLPSEAFYCCYCGANINREDSEEDC